MRLASSLVLILLGCAVMVAPPQDTGDVFKAIRNGDVAYVKAHLTKADLEKRDSGGATPLMFAAVFGNPETFKLILDAGADVNARNKSEATPLLWAARDKVANQRACVCAPGGRCCLGSARTKRPGKRPGLYLQVRPSARRGVGSSSRTDLSTGQLVKKPFGEDSRPDARGRRGAARPRSQHAADEIAVAAIHRLLVTTQ